MVLNNKTTHLAMWSMMLLLREKYSIHVEQGVLLVYACFLLNAFIDKPFIISLNQSFTQSYSTTTWPQYNVNKSFTFHSKCI